MDLDPIFGSRQRLTDDEIEEILEYFVVGVLTDDEMMAAIRRLKRAKSRLVHPLLEMMASPDPNVHMMASALLRELHLTQAIDPLRVLLRSPEIEDDHKLSILQALHTLGGVVPGEDPFVYLQDPDMVLRRTQEDLLDMMQSPFELEMVLRSVLEEDLPLLGSDQAVEILASSMDRRLTPFFSCLLYAPEDEYVLRAIEGLRLLLDVNAVPLLEERAKYDGVAAVRRAARRVAKDLANQAESTGLSVLDLPVAPPPLRRCMLSTIDGNGSQVALVVWQEADGSLVFWNVVFDDHKGIKVSLGTAADPFSGAVQSVSEGMLELGIDMIEVSVERVRAELARAYRTTLEARRRLPLSFLAWRDWLTGEPDSTPPVFPLPTLRPGEQAELLKRSGELFDLDEFATWVLDWDKVRGMARRFLRLVQRRSAPEAIESLVSEAVDKLIDPPYRGLLKERLERQAWLLAQLYEDQDIPKLALAAASAIGEDAEQPLTGHPFVRELVLNSLSRAAEANP
jgi:hypothetical protein